MILALERSTLLLQLFVIKRQLLCAKLALANAGILLFKQLLDIAQKLVRRLRLGIFRFLLLQHSLPMRTHVADKLPEALSYQCTRP